MVLPYLAGNCEKKIICAKQTSRRFGRDERWVVLGAIHRVCVYLLTLYCVSEIVKGSRRHREGSMGSYERNSHAVPLVSGVCRMASAPTLSHGGSRLNASKPEANPKTRCPSNKILLLYNCMTHTQI